MKTRIFKIKSLVVGLVGLFLLLLTAPAYSQACPGNGATLSIGNFAQTSTTIEWDVYITFTTAVSNKFAGYGGNIIYKAGMLPSGATGTFSIVDQPNVAQFPGISATTVAGVHNAAARSLRWTFNPSIPSASAGVMEQNTVYKFARMRFTSSLPWTQNTAGSLAFNHLSAGGNPLNLILVYCGGNPASSTISLANTNLTLSTGQTQNTPFSFTLAPPSCATVATASNLVAESPCAGAANGSALITLSAPTPADAAITYSVDGGATQNANLVGGSFTVSGLTAGNHTVAVTYGGTCTTPVTTSSFAIGAGAPLTTNGSATASICEGQTYVWAANGQSYTTAQSGVTFVSGCNTATLNLSVTPATTTGSETVSVCGSSYTWPLNGQTYNASGSYDYVVGCNTATLNLTLTPNTTTGSESVSVCGTSYTWPLNGQTYNASGSYDYVVGCNTATLTLTLTPNTTTGSESVSVCGTSYTWPLNGQTYNASGSYNHVVGCNTATLSLTLTPNTTTGSESVSVCGTSYTWPLNGQTYNASGSYDYVVGCNTATLTLTLTPNTTTGSESVSVCGTSYTWPLNGQTYNASGSYDYVVGCNTATLSLTLTPNTTTGSESVSVCGSSYTWPLNGQTYNASGSYDYVVGCNTATLSLTLTPNTTTGSESVSVCGTSYTWALNGQTYNASGSYNHVVGCNTATLTLTLTPSTTNGSESVTACGTSYTWAVSGQSYNASGSYDFVSGCNTATLTLTLNTSAQTYYADTDGDGFGAGAAIESCTGQPEGTVTNNTDCAPTNPLAWRIGNFFVDADGDGWNNGFPAAPVCYGALTPAGYTSSNLGTDCGNDDNALQNPNASEISGNGIDDNCDGTTDEVTPTSYLIAANCNSTLTNLANTLFAYPLSSFTTQLGQPQGYRFRVTNGATVRTYDSPTNSFSLLNLVGGATYATVYTVEVSVKTGGHYRAYGSACTVTTPAVPNSTNISNPSCGATLVDISNTIFCTAVPSASGYRFRVRNGATLVGTYDSAVNRFNLTNLGIANIAFGTTYTIDVLLAFGGNLRPEAEYGPACSISTPATPATSRVIQPTCGSSISNLWTTIFAQQVIGAQGYKFVVTNGAQTREFATPNSRFSLRNLVGGAAANTAYTIRVDVLYNSSYVQGTVLCTINTTPGATRQTASALDIYEVKAYPNPYADTFKLDVNTSSEDQVGVRVYDMLGREVEARQASVSNITNLEIGSQYPSGVYNIIVTQGENVKTIRVIKR